MKALLLALAALLALSGQRVTLYLAGYPVAVPVPALIIAAELAACVALAWLICRAVRGVPVRLPRRNA